MTIPESDATETVNKDKLECGEKTCHVLPCNIDYTGMAPTHHYFQPVRVEDGVYASSFRGRGLIASDDTDEGDEEDPGKAFLLSVDGKQLQIKASIDNVMEWQHEHNPKTLKYQENRTRFQMGQEWCQVAKAVRKIKTFIVVHRLI